MYRIVTLKGEQMSTVAPVGKQLKEQRGNLITLLIIIPLRGFITMLGLGVLHNDWSPAVPALGYWASTAVTLMVTSTLGVLRR